MRKMLIVGLAITPMLAATAGVAQQTGVNPQQKAEAEKLTQAPGGSQTSLPQQVPPATTTQATTATHVPPVAEQSNQIGKERIEKEGK